MWEPGASPAENNQHILQIQNVFAEGLCKILFLRTVLVIAMSKWAKANQR